MVRCFIFQQCRFSGILFQMFSCYFQDWKLSLLDQMEAEIKLINELKDKTTILWNRLDLTSEEREQILMADTKSCGKTVRNLVSNFLTFSF